ncbi:MAG: glucuronate isomerase [Promethearchaeota archaeon]
MRNFLDEDFLLHTDTARLLYHEHAEKMPIFDYHCHLPVKEIAEDKRFKNLTEAWLAGDHYKWRAMRLNGIDEKYCTGNATDFEKFQKWAETVPRTIRNPLYHWTHLELQRYFNVKDLLNATTCKQIYDHCSSLLTTSEFSIRNLLRKMKVSLVCTTEDPIDSLEYHQRLKKENFEIKVLPAFRPDRAMAIEEPEIFKQYVQKLSETCGSKIHDFHTLMCALDSRHAYFHQNGCRLSDHGILKFHAENYNENKIDIIFKKVLSGKHVKEEEEEKFKSAFLLEMARLNYKRGWVQQFHFGALRNINTRYFKLLGPDTGFDSIGDFLIASDMVKFLDTLDQTNELAKTVLFNLNPRDNYVVASIIGAFQDSSIPNKVQFGPAWWFLDQKEGIEMQLNALSNLGLLSRFIGMTTDSRSFLSFPRHEYFRRILCNVIGTEIERGELPNDMNFVGKIVEDICYNNVVNYFNFSL